MIQRENEKDLCRGSRFLVFSDYINVIKNQDIFEYMLKTHLTFRLEIFSRSSVVQWYFSQPVDII